MSEAGSSVPTAAVSSATGYGAAESNFPLDAPLSGIASGLAAADAELVALAQAYAAQVYADRLLGTGEPALAHGLGAAVMAADLRLDAQTRAAALLFAVPAFLADSREALTERFGPAVAGLVDGISQLNRLRVLIRKSTAPVESGGSVARTERASQIEVLRKMLLAMVEDIRVVLLRLASRTQTLRYLTRTGADQREAIARETLDLYAPLANRLGIWQLKWELEDLSFRFLEPELYKRIARMLDERRVERESFIADVIAQLSRELKTVGLKAEVTGRPKHIYSIWNKMRGKGLDFSELHDVRALRVIVESEEDCYTALGVVHNLWQPIPSEFDDYIARPKSNDYRSLHTAVTPPDGRSLEVQIRTHDMHRFAELGVAAHWRYKEAGGGRAAARGDRFDEKIALLRRMLAWRDEVVDSSDWIDQAKHVTLDDTVYVLTPQGKVIDLPHGATPVDFAYSLHTELGHRCRGAKVNGQMVSLDYRLSNGDRVEITAAKTGGPSRDWLNPDVGFIGSSRARNKVRQWFNSLALDKTIAEGRAQVERELARAGAGSANLDTLATTLGFAGSDELFAAVGRDEIGMRRVRTALLGPETTEPEPEPLVVRGKAKGVPGGVLVVGVDRLLTQLARCCKPVPPDPIGGFVTRGRGVSIHRRNCPSLAVLAARHPERMLDAAWGSSGEGAYPVDILVRATDRQALLRDISEVLARERLNVVAANTLSRGGTATLLFTVEVANLDDMRRALPLIAAVPGVVSAVRR